MTFDELGQEHAAKRAGVSGSRRKAHAELGPLAATYEAAMALFARQKAEGVSLAERLGGLEKTLRVAWPKGRENEWKYPCAKCGDYGLEMAWCDGDATCGREKRHLRHEFGTPCWCPAGKRFKATQKQAADFTEATQTKQPTRLGRR